VKARRSRRKERKRGKDDSKSAKDDSKQIKQEKNDKKFFADKECFNCGKTGHGAKNCPNKKSKGDDADDNSSISSKSSKIDKIKKQIKEANKQFTQMLFKIEAEDEDSSSDEEQSHFQFLHLCPANFHHSPDKTLHELSMKQSKGKFADLNLQQVILLDNQSTMSLFCNKTMVSNIRRTDSPLTLRSNGGSMEVRHLASIGDDKPGV
jgi:hypothetical protein